MLMMPRLLQNTQPITRSGAYVSLVQSFLHCRLDRSYHVAVLAEQSRAPDLCVWWKRARLGWRQIHDSQLHANTSNDDRTQCTAAFGQVMSAQANFVRVRLERLDCDGAEMPIPKQDLLCVVRAVLKKAKRTVVVGDKVRVVGIDWVDGRGMVEEVFPRVSYLSDPTIANVDHIVLVFALDRPPFEPANVTRYMVGSEAAGLPFTVVLNKSDLVTAHALEEIQNKVLSWGYQPVAVSVTTGEGIMELEERLRDKVSVLAGPSGVGKSSIINALWSHAAAAPPVHPPPDVIIHSTHTDTASSEVVSSSIWDSNPHQDSSTASHDSSTASHDSSTASHDSSTASHDSSPTSHDSSPTSHDSCTNGEVDSATSVGGVVFDEGGVGWGGMVFEEQAVGDVSGIGRGKHTTRNVTLLPLPAGGVVADTPGFNQPNLSFDPADLAECFPEVRQRLELERCTFSDCSHMHEPGCAVGQDWERYPFYCALYQELGEGQKVDKQRAMGKKQREGTMRYKSRSGGVQGAEVRLETKSHRRVSRRSAKQRVQNAVDDDLDD